MSHKLQLAIVKSNLPIAAQIVTVISALLGGTGACAAKDVARPVDCAALVDAAALRAMGQTGPLGQMQIWGAPVAFGPNLRRVEVDVFGGGEYDVDVTIDRNCEVLSATTRLNSNGPP